MQDLDIERERRWKAEQAADKLVEHVRTLQTKLGDTQTKHELCVVKNSQLNTQFTGANQAVESLRGQVEDLRGQLVNCRSELDKQQGREVEQMDLLKTLEENCHKLEREKMKQRTELSTRAEEAERRSVGHQRETELLTKSVRHLKGQLQQTQELLATRERDHQTQLEKCRPMESREVSSLELHLSCVFLNGTSSGTSD